MSCHEMLEVREEEKQVEQQENQRSQPFRRG